MKNKNKIIGSSIAVLLATVMIIAMILIFSKPIEAQEQQIFKNIHTEKVNKCEFSIIVDEQTGKEYILVKYLRGYGDGKGAGVSIIPRYTASGSIVEGQ